MTASSGGCYIHAISTAVPEKSLSFEQGAELLKQGCVTPRSAKLLSRIAQLTGIEKRHLAALDFMPGESPLYRPASEQPTGPGMTQRTALFDRAASPLIAHMFHELPSEQLARVGNLVTATCTHAASPGLEQHVFKHISLPASVQRWNLGFMGCSAGLAAVRLISRIVEPGADSLVVVCELSSLHFQYSDQIDQMTANVLFSDGAAAMLLSPKPSSVRVIDCRCVTIAQFADQMVWFAGDFGLQLRLSQDLPKTLAKDLPGVIDEFLRDNNLNRDDVQHWLVHPGGPQILDCVEHCLNLSNDALVRSRCVLRQFGNMSSPTIFFILKDLVDTDGWGKALAMAFGPGLTIEVVLLEIEPSNS